MRTINGLPEDFEEQVAAIRAAVPPENVAAADAIYERWLATQRAALAAQPPKPRERRTMKALWAAARLGFRQMLMQWRHPEALLAAKTMTRREHKVLCFWLRAIEHLVGELVTAMALAIAPTLPVEPPEEMHDEAPKCETPARDPQPAIPDPTHAATWRTRARSNRSTHTRSGRTQAGEARRAPTPDDPVSTQSVALRLEAVRRIIANRRAIAERRARAYARQRARDAHLPDPARFPRRPVNPHPMLGTITSAGAIAHDKTYDTWSRWRGPD